MTFHYAPAVRERVSLIIALAAASGGGKTRSALAIARGLAGGDDSRIAYIDTEAGRALHYAVAPSEAPTADRFAFMHGDLKAPFTPESYADAIKAADDTGKFDVIVVDSCSHEWEGEGGLHDEHQDGVAAAVEKARAAAAQNNWRFDEEKAATSASCRASCNAAPT
jgi:RecA/RadA recombinase